MFCISLYFHFYMDCCCWYHYDYHYGCEYTILCILSKSVSNLISIRSCSRVSTTILLHYLDFNETSGEKLNGNYTLFFKQILEAASHKTEFIQPLTSHLTSWRYPWCNGYGRRKWTRRHEFKSWTRLIAFHIALIPLGKVWIQLFSLQLWVNSRED